MRSSFAAHVVASVFVLATSGFLFSPISVSAQSERPGAGRGGQFGGGQGGGQGRGGMQGGRQGRGMQGGGQGRGGQRGGQGRGGQGRGGQGGGGGGGKAGGPERSPMVEVGQTFPTTTTYADDGTEVIVPSAVNGKYTVLVRGCLTCPVFWRSYHETEAVARDYLPQGVQFYFVYGALAHPENNGYVQPYSQEERLMHVAEAKKKMQTTVPWLADNMDNGMRWAMGNFPNSECLLDPQGKVVYVSSWSNSGSLRESLAKHVGPVENPTRASDLNLPTIQRERTDEVVPRVQVSEELTGVKVKPQPSNEPLYAKLRCEVAPSVIESGSGQIYLGFHLDPLYDTHWNNLAEPLKYELTDSTGAKINPASGQAPKVSQESDTGPREFLVDIEGADTSKPLTLTAFYYACSDSPAFCKAVKQTYEITLEKDLFAGGVNGRSFRFGGNSRGGGGAGNRGGGGSRGGAPGGRRPTR